MLWASRIHSTTFLIMLVMDLGRVTTDLFAGPFRPCFTLVVPIALIATLPSKALLGLLEPATALYPLIATSLLLVASNRFWTCSLRRCSSASS